MKHLSLMVVSVICTVSVVLSQDSIERIQFDEISKFGSGTTQDNVSYEKFLISPNEEKVAILSSGRIEVWDLSTQNLTTTIEEPFSSFGFGVFTWSPDGSQIATIVGETELYIWDALNGELVRTHDGVDLGSNGTRAIEWHQPDTITTGSFEYLTWNINSEDTPHVVNCHPWGSLLWWSSNGEYIATMGSDSTLVWICDTEFNRLLSIEGYTTVEWSPDNTEIATVGIFNTLRVWSVESGEVISTSEGGENTILNIDWHLNGTTIVTGHSNGEVRVWERLTPDAFWLIGTIQIPEITDVAWFGDQLITISDTGYIQVWNVNI